MVVAFVGVEVLVAVIPSGGGVVPGTIDNVRVADEAMSPDDAGANAVVFAGLKFVLGAFGVVSLDDGEPPEATVDVVIAGLRFVLGAFGVVSLDDGESSEAPVDTVVGLATRVTSSVVDGAAVGAVVEVAVRVSSAGDAGAGSVTPVELAAEVAASRVSSAGSFGAKWRKIVVVAVLVVAAASVVAAAPVVCLLG